MVFAKGYEQSLFPFRDSEGKEKQASEREIDCSSTGALGKVRFFLGGRAGASEGRVISESEHQKGRAIPHVSYSREGHTSFPEFFNENCCDVAFHFSYRLSFSFHQL